MSTVATTAFVVGGAVLNYIGTMKKTENEMEQQDIARKEALFNARQLEYAAQQAYWERSTSVSQQIDKGLKDIAEGRAKMGSSGNIGPSAESNVIGSMMNLDQDLSAIYYRYTNEAIKYKNAAMAQKFNADVYKRNRTNAMIGGLLEAGTGIMNTGLKGYQYGLWG